MKQSSSQNKMATKGTKKALRKTSKSTVSVGPATGSRVVGEQIHSCIQRCVTRSQRKATVPATVPITGNNLVSKDTRSRAQRYQTRRNDTPATVKSIVRKDTRSQAKRNTKRSKLFSPTTAPITPTAAPIKITREECHPSIDITLFDNVYQSNSVIRDNTTEKAMLTRGRNTVLGTSQTQYNMRIKTTVSKINTSNRSRRWCDLEIKKIKGWTIV